MLWYLGKRLKIQNEKQEDKVNLEREDWFTGVTLEEIKFLNLLKLILDAGWCLDPNSLQDVLRISGIDDKIEYGIKLMKLESKLRLENEEN